MEDFKVDEASSSMLVLTYIEGASPTISSDPREMVHRESIAIKSKRSKTTPVLKVASEFGSFSVGPTFSIAFSGSSSVSPLRIKEGY